MKMCQTMKKTGMVTTMANIPEALPTIAAINNAAIMPTDKIAHFPIAFQKPSLYGFSFSGSTSHTHTEIRHRWINIPKK